VTASSIVGAFQNTCKALVLRRMRQKDHALEKIVNQLTSDIKIRKTATARPNSSN
jgi:hypothetical protein